MRLFISYRRSDSQQIVDQLESILIERLAGVEVFRDVGGIEPGDNWKKLISAKINTSDIMLVIIGPDWLTAKKSGERRLYDSNDIVCYEIALAISKGVLMIPVLIKGALFPDANELPSNIRYLAQINAYTIRPQALDIDIKLLIKRLGFMLGTTIQEQPSLKAREFVRQSIHELSVLIQSDPHVKDFDFYWRWFIDVKKLLREFSIGTQIENEIKRLDLLLSEAKESEMSDRELVMLELEETLVKIKTYFTTAEEQKIDVQRPSEEPGDIRILPGVDLTSFSVMGHWQCEVSGGSDSICIQFDIATDETVSGLFIDANGKHQLDGKYMLNVWTPPDEDRYVGSPPKRVVGILLSGVLNRREPFKFEIPLAERHGSGYRGSDKQGHIFFTERE